MGSDAKMEALSARLLSRPEVCCVHIFWCALLTVLVAMTVSGQTAQNQTGQNHTEQVHIDCQQRLMEAMYGCVSEQGVDFNDFLTLVSDGLDTNSTAAASSSNVTAAASSSNVTASSSSSIPKDKICGARQEIMNCVLKTAKTLVSDPSCVGQGTAWSGSGARQDETLKDQRFLIKEQLEAVIGQYDIVCAHPCRISLLDDMRACYTQYDLDPQLFISTEASGPVIGTTRSEVTQFCTNSDAIFRCLEKSRDDCQESHVVLSSIGLDLEFMSKGVRVLCADQETYMKSLDCFDSHTKEVEYCQSVKYRFILAMAIKAREESWTEERYYLEICGAILNHIQCDLDAWAGKGDEDCSENTLSLKRKLHCTIIPKKCETSHNDSMTQTCTAVQTSAGLMRLASRWYFLLVIFSVFVHFS